MRRSTFAAELARGGITRRTFLASSLATVGASYLPGLAQAQASKLTALMPGVMIPDTSRAPLTAAAGATIENLPYISATDIVAKILARGGTARYDLGLSMTNFTGDPLMKANALMPLDPAKLPNLAQLDPAWRKRIVEKNGKTYMVPVMWAYDSVLFNKDFIDPNDPAVNSWGMLFDDRFAGKVALRDDAYQTIALTARFLGIEQPATMSAKDLKQVIAFLKSKKKNFRTLWSNYGEAVNLMLSKELHALMGWMPMRLQLQQKGLNVTNNWPKEGLLTFNNSAYIPKDSKNSDQAHKAINYFLSTEYANELTRVYDYGVTNGPAISAMPADIQKRVGYQVIAGELKTYPYTWPNDMDAWITAWNEFKIA